MSQLLADAGPYTLSLSWYDPEGELDPDIDAVTIGIVDGNGDEVVASGTATTDGNDGTYTYALASQTNPDVLKVTWQDASTSASIVQRVELVGRHLFSVAAARTFGAKADATAALKPLASTTEYLTATIQEERTRITDDLEFWTGRAWIPRYARMELCGTGSTTLKLQNGVCRTADGYGLNRPGRLTDIAQLLSVTVGGTSVDVDNVTVDPVKGHLILESGVWTPGTVETPFNVIVEYVYGASQVIDGVDRIALKILVDRLVPSAYPDRALRIEGEYGAMQLVQPGGPMNNVSRVPEVNDWVRRHDHRILVG